jgi:hypothetical protein
MRHEELIPQCIQGDTVLVLLPSSMAGTPGSHAAMTTKPKHLRYVLCARCAVLPSVRTFTGGRMLVAQQPNSSCMLLLKLAPGQFSL